jgi:pimeloyl-ACP methyl ester carboxylesterase
VTLACQHFRETVDVSGIQLDMITMGKGPDLLFLHGGEGPDVPSDGHLRALSRHFRVLAPWHPGFGRTPRPDGMREVGDLAYLYLDLAAKLGLQDAVLVGASFGGWVAAEMMVRDSAAFALLVLSAPLGIKVRGREERDIEDFFALTPEQFRALAYAEPARGEMDLRLLDDEHLTAHLRSHESLAVYGWKPYMHNPQLKRWLHRVDLPTLLVAGQQDRFVFDGYHAAYAQALPNAVLHSMPDAGHFPHVEQPELFADLVRQHRDRAVALRAHASPAHASTANA